MHTVALNIFPFFLFFPSFPCLGTSRHEKKKTVPHLVRFDSRLRDSLATRLSLPNQLPPSALLSYSQPIGNGGRGFRSLALTAAAAKWASATAVSFDVQHLVDAAVSPLPFMLDRDAAHQALLNLGVQAAAPDVDADHDDFDLCKLPLDPNDIVGYYGSAPWAPGLQRSLSMSVEKAQLASFLDSSACSPLDTARFCSNKNRYTTRWLSTSTVCRPLSSKAVSLAVRLHDGLPPASDLPTHCWLGKDSVCNADLTVNPWHCLSCPALKCRSIYRRHNAVVDLLLRFARAHSCLAHAIKKDLSDRVPDGLVHFGDRSVYFDVSGVSLTAPSYSHMAPGAALRARETSKVTKYFNFARDNDAKIAPFVLDCFGSLGKKSMQFLDSIVEESALDLCPSMTKSSFLTQLSVVWQAGNAKIFQEWATEMRKLAHRSRQRPSVSLAARLVGTCRA